MHIRSERKKGRTEDRARIVRVIGRIYNAKPPF